MEEIMFLGQNHNTTSSFRFTAATVLSRTNKEKFRIAIAVSQAAFQFINGIDGLDRYIQDKEYRERTEEENEAGSSHYCHCCYSCDQVITTTIEDFVGVSSLQHAKLPEPKTSASDSNGNDAMRILHSDQTVLDIVEGSSLESLSFGTGGGSHDYDNYGQTNQTLGHDDTNLSESLLFGVDYDHASSSNVSVLAVPSASSPNTLLSLSVATNAAQPPHPGTTIASSAWIFAATGFSFEAVSALFDQVSSPRKPRYALYGMLLSIVAVLVCTLDLILNAAEQGRMTSESNIMWDILPEIFGLALACIQCISSVLQFSYLSKHAANPWKISLVPFLFFFVLFVLSIEMVEARCYNLEELPTNIYKVNLNKDIERVVSL